MIFPKSFPTETKATIDKYHIGPDEYFGEFGTTVKYLFFWHKNTLACANYVNDVTATGLKLGLSAHLTSTHFEVETLSKAFIEICCGGS